MMKKLLLFFSVMFALCFGIAVASEIAKPKEEDSFISITSDEVASLCRKYEKHLDELVDALEKCAKSDTDNNFPQFVSWSESCAQCLPIMAKSEHIDFTTQLGDIIDRSRDFLSDKEVKYTLKLILAIEERMGKEFIKKLQKSKDLGYSCGELLYETRNTMAQDIELSKFNAYLPDILRDECEKSDGKLTWNQGCVEIQKMFQMKIADLNGEYSPFSANIVQQGDYRYGVVLGAAPTKPEDLAKEVEHLCSYSLKLSEETTNQLVQLVMDGYNGNRKCGKGPVLDVQLERKKWELEGDLRKRKTIATIVSSKLAEGSDAQRHIGSSLFTLKLNTPECRRFEDLSVMLYGRFGESKLYYSWKPYVDAELACENTLESRSYESWERYQKLNTMLGQTGDEEKKQMLKNEQTEILKNLLDKNEKEKNE